MDRITQKRRESFHSLEQSFETDLKKFEKRFGYTFFNRETLKQALTLQEYVSDIQKVYKSTGREKVRLSSARLESRGNKILNRLISEAGSRKAHAPGLGSFLQSNVLFSRAALRVGLHEVIRPGAVRLSSNSAEKHVRTLANSFEAFFFALTQDSPLGKVKAETLFREYITQDVFATHVAPRLFSENLDEINAALGEISHGAIKIERDDKNPKHFVITKDAERKPTTVFDSPLLAVWRILKENPWFVWGYDGPVSIRYTQAGKFNSAKKSVEDVIHKEANVYPISGIT
jgi:dsRNA-specific ribonuclease